MHTSIGEQRFSRQSCNVVASSCDSLLVVSLLATFEMRSQGRSGVHEWILRYIVLPLSQRFIRAKIVSWRCFCFASFAMRSQGLLVVFLLRELCDAIARCPGGVPASRALRCDRKVKTASLDLPCDTYFYWNTDSPDRVAMLWHRAVIVYWWCRCLRPSKCDRKVEVASNNGSLGTSSSHCTKDSFELK